MTEEHIQMNLFDEEILHPNCTVQELRNTETGEASFGWWENESPPKGVVKTHYDQVKVMSLEELAEFLTPVKCVDCHLLDCGIGEIGDNRTCEQRIRDWLNTEVEE